MKEIVNFYKTELRKVKEKVKILLKEEFEKVATKILKEDSSIKLITLSIFGLIMYDENDKIIHYYTRPEPHFKEANAINSRLNQLELRDVDFSFTMESKNN